MTLLSFFPFWTMHFCTYVIIGPKGDIETQVATALAPFDEALEVERYKVYLEEAEIKRMAGHYGLEKSDSPALIEKMPDWRGTKGGLDEIGLFSWTTANPQGTVGLVRDRRPVERAGSAAETSSRRRRSSICPT